MRSIHSAIHESAKPYAGSLREQTIRFLSQYNAEVNKVAEKAAILDDIASKLAPMSKSFAYHLSLAPTGVLS